MRAPLSLIAAVVIALGVRVALVRDALPQRIASHFGPSGVPDAFMPTHAFFALQAGISLFTIASLLLAPLLLRVVPDALINLPNRKYWLSPEHKPRALRTLATWFAWYAAWLSLFLAAVLELVLRANLARGRLDAGLFMLVLAVFVVGTVLALVRLVRAFRVPGS
jgi:uncharacterized membrane protein